MEKHLPSMYKVREVPSAERGRKGRNKRKLLNVKALHPHACDTRNEKENGIKHGSLRLNQVTVQTTGASPSQSSSPNRTILLLILCMLRTPAHSILNLDNLPIDTNNPNSLCKKAGENNTESV